MQHIHRIALILTLCLCACVPKGARNWLFSIGPQTYAVALGDLDGDGDLDAYLANGENEVPAADTLWLNDGQAGFSNSGQQIGERESHSVLLADFDADGDLDALTANTGDLTLYANDGLAGFGQAPASLMGSEYGNYSMAPGAADLDGDGDLDLIAGGCCGGALTYQDGRTQVFPPTDHLWFNAGDGTFSPSQQVFDAYGTQSIGLGDLDQDGDIDAVFGNTTSTDPVTGAMDHTQPVTLWFNQGGSQGSAEGAFVLSSQMLGDPNAQAIHLADLNQDRDLDLLIAARNAIGFWINEGGRPPGFRLDDRLELEDELRDLLAGDLDGDGRLDLVAVGKNEAQVYFRQPDTAAELLYQPGPRLSYKPQHALALGDLDGDGDLDVFAGSVYHQILVWLNDGRATFERFETPN